MFEAIILVVIPGVLANVLHMFFVKKNMLPFLAVPLNTKLFGSNKTWRGFIFLTVSTALFCAVMEWLFKLEAVLGGALLGAILGFTYMLFELPNSMFKRWKGIASGETPKKGNKIFYALLDKTDSAFGVSLIYTLISDLSIVQGLLLFAISSGLHISISFLLVFLKIKKSF